MRSSIGSMRQTASERGLAANDVEAEIASYRAGKEPVNDGRVRHKRSGLRGPVLRSAGRDYRRIDRSAFALALTPAILNECENVLSRGRFSLSVEAAQILVRDLEPHSVVVNPKISTRS